MQSGTAWRPLLDGATAKRAREAIDTIRDALLDHPPRTPPVADMDDAGRGTTTEQGSLAGGYAGLAILYAYLGEATSTERDLETAAGFLQRAIKWVSTQPMPPSLYTGFTGVAWAVEHLRERLFDADEEDPNEEIDAALSDYLNESPWRGSYDLIYGLVGLGVYALERLPRPGAVSCLERIVDLLGETAVHDTGGVSWFTPPEDVLTRQRQRSPDGHFNTGVAHGVPGVIALLSQACRRNVAREKALPLLKEAIRWLLGQKLNETSECSFPSWVGPGITPSPSRLAWCYGDPGVAASLLGAARAIGERDWVEEAIAIARRVASPAKQSGVVDAGLCHGAAGLGHLYNRMYQATGDAVLGEAARFWFGRALAMRKMGEGVAGYSAWLVIEDDTMGWVADPGLLNGAAGIALAFLAAVSSIEPAWDRMLMISIPPSHRS